MYGIAHIILSGGVKFETGSRKEITIFIDAALETLLEGFGAKLDSVDA